MTQTLKFKVVGVAQHMIPVDGVVGGEKMTVQVPALVVDLASEDGTMHPAIRFRKDIDALATQYVVGADVVVTLTVSKGEKE